MLKHFAGRTGVAAAIALLMVTPATAQVERGSLRLVVRDATGLPLRASGSLLSEAPQTQRTFETDSAGTFTLERLPFGIYRLTIERDGFAPHTELLDVHSAVPRTLEVRLSVATFTAQVDVRTDPPLIDPSRTGVVHAVGALQIREHLATSPGRRLLDLIDAQPGWLMEANGVLHPRGSEYQTLFVVDGVPMDENRSPAFAPDFQDVEIDALHVLTGNFPAEYGRKLGGVVEVTTGKDIRGGFHGYADVGVGSFAMAGGSFSGTYGWADRALSASISAARSNRYLDPPVRENFTNSGSLAGVMIGYDDRPSAADRLHLTLHHRRTSFQVPNELQQQAAGQLQEADGRDLLAQAAWTRVVGSRTVVNARGVVERLSAGLRSNDEATPIRVSQDRRFTRGYANASVAADLGRHQLKFGGDLLFAPVVERLEYRITDPDFFDDDTAQAFTFADRRNDREQSLFVQDTIGAGPFTVSAGVRWDRYALTVDDTAVSPRLGIAWASPGGQLVLRASYDRAFQTPAVENLLLASSPLVDELGPETARLPVEPSRGNFVEGGFTAAIAQRARLDVTAYRRTFTNFADDDVFLNTGVSFPVSFAAAEVAGLDSKLTLPPWRGVNGFISYSLLKGTAELPLVGGLFLGDEALENLDASGRVPITQDQRHTLRAQVRVDLVRRAWMAGTVRYGSGLPVEFEQEIDGDELASQYGPDLLDRVDLEHERVRANVSVEVGAGAELWRGGRQRLSLRGEITNVLNRLNVINFSGLFSGTALGAPRSAAVRLQLEF